MLIFTFVWLLFYLYNRNEVKKMNEKIASLENEQRIR
ncbi:MAG: DUF3021 family protein [Lysinibacillus sp.]